jgi:hypothetical protein
MGNKVYTDIIYIDSLDNDECKAEALLRWSEMYLDGDFEAGLTIEEMRKLNELIYKNIIFLKDYLSRVQTSTKEVKSIKKFYGN